MIRNSFFIAITLTIALGASMSIGGSINNKLINLNNRTLSSSTSDSGVSNFHLNHLAPKDSPPETGEMMPPTTTAPVTRPLNDISVQADDDGDGINFNGPALSGTRIDLNVDTESQSNDR